MNTALKRGLALGMLLLMLVSAVPFSAFAGNDGCEHDSEGIYVYMQRQERTCTEDGHEAGFWCPKCNKFVIDGATIPSYGGHDWGAWTDKGNGTHARSCKRSGCTATEAVAHTWGDGVVTAQPKCDKEGTKTFSCTVCAATKTEPIAKTAHEYVTTTVAPDCENEGYVLHECRACGDRYKTNIVPANGHEWGDWTAVDPGDCDHGAKKERVCGVCGKKETKTGAAPGHDYQKTVIAPTCEEAGKTTYTCSRCGDTYDTNPEKPLGHKIVKQDAVEATCEHPGLTEGKKCERCGKIYVAQKEIPQVEHKIITIAPIAATCQNEGRTEGSYCEYCGKVFKESTTEPKTDHNYVERILKVATCTDSGLVTKTCSYCDESVTEEIPATGHKYEKVVISEPTCDVGGVSKKVCTVCGKETAETVIPAAGHKWSKQWTIDKAATCTAAGRKSIHCTVCNQKTKTTTIPAKGHKYTAATTTIKTATTSRNGKVTRVCAVCGEGKTVTEVRQIGTIKLNKTSYVCDGKVKKPTVVVKDVDGNTLTSGTDYKVSYDAGRKKPGTYAVKVTFTKFYSGAKTLKFKITLAAPKTVKTAVDAQKNTVKVAYSQVTGAQKYIIYYKTSKNGTYEKLGTSTTQTFKTKALKPGKTYYFTVRAFSAANGKVYSDYSTAATAKIPKAE